MSVVIDNEQDYGPLAKYIRQLRKAAGLSQPELARRSGVKRGDIDALERGRSKHPESGTLEALAPHLGVPVQRILYEGGLISYEIMEASLNPEYIAKQLIAVSPIRIPVYKVYPFKPGVEVVNHKFIAKDLRLNPETIEAYVVNTEYHISPAIGIGDVVIVDRKAEALEGDSVIALNKEGLAVVGRLVKSESGEFGVATRTSVFFGCSAVSLVVEVHKRLKHL